MLAMARKRRNAQERIKLPGGLSQSYVMLTKEERQQQGKLQTSLTHTQTTTYDQGRLGVLIDNG